MVAKIVGKIGSSPQPAKKRVPQNGEGDYLNIRFHLLAKTEATSVISSLTTDQLVW